MTAISDLPQALLNEAKRQMTQSLPRCVGVFDLATPVSAQEIQ
jgi:hypothetical protein